MKRIVTQFGNDVADQDVECFFAIVTLDDAQVETLRKAAEQIKSLGADEISFVFDPKTVGFTVIEKERRSDYSTPDFLKAVVDAKGICSLRVVFYWREEWSDTYDSDDFHPDAEPIEIGDLCLDALMDDLSQNGDGEWCYGELFEQVAEVLPADVMTFIKAAGGRI